MPLRMLYDKHEQQKQSCQRISTVISDDMIRIVCAMLRVCVALLLLTRSKHFLHFYCHSDNFLQFFTNKTRPSVTYACLCCARVEGKKRERAEKML